MRVTPLVCVICGSWYQPKSRRSQKFCSNACRQHNHVNPDGKWFCKLRAKDDAGNKEMQDAFVKYCDCPDGYICIECVMKKDYRLYCNLIYKYGRDKYDTTAKSWLKESKKTGS